MLRRPFLAVAATLAAVAAVATLAASPPPSAAPGTRLVGWNNLGMHCMDSDYSLFSILPPYNTFHAQLVRNGALVRSASGVTVTYEAVADAAGSINTTSAGKTTFWDHVKALFGASPPIDMGLAGKPMPGASNAPVAMTWDALNSWWIAEGVPITPRDDAGNRNPYPMMRLAARDAQQQVIATTDIVLPVSDEMSCRTCHLSGSSSGAQPVAGWVNDANPEHDWRLNILRRHDDVAGPFNAYAPALAANGYDAAGLFATATGGHPVLCAACHASNALGTTGAAGVSPLTTSVHSRHATVIDPRNGLALDAVENRSACYVCHPGSATRCLRGAMGSAVAPDGTMAMQCTSCHGSMLGVGSTMRKGWLDEPNCQACHTGTAVANSGQIRYTDAFDSGTHLRVPADATFATTPDTPMPGTSLFRFSHGHGGLACEACHGSTHAEFPTTHANDNVQSLGVQGHVGMLVECAVCHGTSPNTVTGGPHGMHPVGQDWVDRHSDALEAQGSAASCTACHGADWRGTVLSKAQADRTLAGFGTHRVFRGSLIGCYLCHAGPKSESATTNPPPVAANASAATISGNSVVIPLVATDSAQSSLTYRIVSQPANGTVGLLGATATYFPADGFIGTDTFTFAARDGFADSNLATVQVNVGAVPPRCDLKPTWISVKVKGRGKKLHLATTVVVANVGAVNAPATSLAIGMSSDGTMHPADPVLKSVTVGAIKIGKQRKMTINVPLAKGTVTNGNFVIGVVNATGTIPDANRANDSAVYGPMR